MKKFFAFVAAALVAFSFASCEGGNSPEANGFKITVDSLTSSSAYVLVEAKDADATFYTTVVETAQLAKLSDDSLVAAVKETIEYYVAIYQYIGYDATFADFLSKGKDGYKYESLDQNTDYTVVAFYMNEKGEATSGIAKKSFKTPELKAEKVQEITLQNAICFDACDADGWWQLYAAPADSSYLVSISPLDAQQLAGTWTIDDMDPEYTVIYFQDETYATFATCDVTTKVENDMFILTGKALGSNAVEYHFNISAEIEVLSIEDMYAPKRAPKKAVPAFNKHFVLK